MWLDGLLGALKKYDSCRIFSSRHKFACNVWLIISRFILRLAKYEIFVDIILVLNSLPLCQHYRPPPSPFFLLVSVGISVDAAHRWTADGGDHHLSRITCIASVVANPGGDSRIFTGDGCGTIMVWGRQAPEVSSNQPPFFLIQRLPF